MHRSLVIVTFILALLSGGACMLTLRERWSALRWLVISAVAVLVEYIAASAALFLAERFTLPRALLIPAALNLAGLACLAGVRLGKRKALFGTVGWSLSGAVVPIALAVVALLLGSGHFGFFGMGQDEGVYQTRAIDLMNGRYESTYHFDEFQRLETQAQRDRFLLGTRERLGGLYSLEVDASRETVLEMPAFAQRIAIGDYDEAEAIYHGLPTFPAVLALFGVLGGGYSHMMDAQTVFYVLSVLVIWYTCKNLGLKTAAAAFACVVYALSPQTVWLSKSALTETAHALLICLFMYLITEAEHPRRRWLSALAVAAFALWHVSIYVMFPLFAALYILLYLIGGDRQYLGALALASVLYLFGLAFMTVVSPYYLVMNLFPLMKGPITQPIGAWYVAVCMGVAGLVAAALLRLLTVPKSRRQVLKSRAAGLVFRLAIAAMLGMAVLTFGMTMAGEGLSSAALTNGLYMFLWLTGFVAVPMSVVWLLKRGSRSLAREPVAAIVCMFLYMVLLMICYMRASVSYCYYYSRYLGPYIPVAGVMAGIAANRLSSRGICAGILASAVVMAPFDGVLVTRNDDTYYSFDAIDRVAGALPEGNAAVVFSADDGDIYRLLYLPVRSGGIDCYLQEDDVDAQLDWLAGRYDTLCFIGGGGVPAALRDNVVTRLREQVSTDDNVSNRLPYCPLPLDFYRDTWEITVYRRDVRRVFPAAALATSGHIEGEDIVLGPWEAQFGPYVRLAAGRYRIEIAGAGFEGASFDATGDSGTRQLPLEIVERGDGRIVYELELDASADNVEFRVFCPEQGEVRVRRVTLTDLAFEKTEGDQ